MKTLLFVKQSLLLCRDNFIKKTIIKINLLMKKQFLLPNKFKKIGWCFLIPSLITIIFLHISDYQVSWLKIKTFAIVSDRDFFKIVEVDFTFTLISILIIIGGLLVAFSKEKNEDEYIEKLRLSSFQWSVIVNSVLLLFCVIFIYDISFLTVMVYNMFTVLILFIVRFNFLLYRNNKATKDEK